MRDKIIVTLKEFGVAAAAPHIIDELATRIEALYSGGVSEKEKILIQESLLMWLSDEGYLNEGGKEITQDLSPLSHTTPEISEEEIRTSVGNLYDKYKNRKLAMVDAFTYYINVRLRAKWALSKGAKPMSEERIEEIAHKVANELGGRLYGDYYNAAKAALEELNKQ